MGSAATFAERQAAALQSKSVKKKVAPTKEVTPSESDELSEEETKGGGTSKKEVEVVAPKKKKHAITSKVLIN